MLPFMRVQRATAVLRKQQAAAGWVQQILNARVPIIKFTESSTGEGRMCSTPQAALLGAAGPDVVQHGDNISLAFILAHQAASAAP